jgi:CRISPR/Cas system endoribonuclease Cas6 (RAMP superfamily)
MGGVVGEAVYEGDLGPFAPLLALGEVLHVGKGTGFGLGRYEIASNSGNGSEQQHGGRAC